MDDEDVDVYRRIDIVVGGESLTARPIEFEYDNEENPIKVLKYETTCPNCGQAIQFALSETIIINDISNVSCTCDANNKKIIKNTVEIKASGQESRFVKMAVQLVPFIDPIESGAFDPNQVNFDETNIR